MPDAAMPDADESLARRQVFLLPLGAMSPFVEGGCKWTGPNNLFLQACHFNHAYAQKADFNFKLGSCLCGQLNKAL